MGRRKKGSAVKGVKGKQLVVQEEEYKKAPHSFVFHRGHVGKNIKQLVKDTKQVMEPYTASSLQVRKKNVLKDFVNIAGVLNVSHFMIFTKTDVSTYLKICRLPRGPTMTFKVQNYCLSKDVVCSLKKPNMEPKQFQHHPLLVMNNFAGDQMHLKLMSTMFQNMFPSINVNRVNLNNIKRCVMVSYNTEEKTIDFRHYNIKVVPVGMSRSVKKLIKASIPDMSKFNDVSDYVTGGGNLSESEAELDGPDNEVELPQQINSRGNIKSTKSAIRLTEIGPRFTLQLVKIEDGICQGDVLFHEFISKSQEDLKNLKALREHKRKIKEIRRKKQEENVKKKQQAKDEHKEKSLKGMKKKETEEESDVEDPETKDGEGEHSDDDDIEYYKQEVGEAPDPDLFQSRRPKTKKRPFKEFNKRVKSTEPARKKQKSSGTSDKRVDKKTVKKTNIGKGKKVQKDSFQKGKTQQKGFKMKNKMKRSGEVTKKPKFKAKKKQRK